MPFHKLRLIEPLLRAIGSVGYTIPTEIQTEAIPHVLEGRDLLGQALPGQPIVRRYSGGQDRMAACGMLASKTR